MTKRLKLLNRIIAIFLAAALFMEGAQTGYAAAVSENEVSGNEILENEILENEISAAAEHLVDTGRFPPDFCHYPAVFNGKRMEPLNIPWRANVHLKQAQRIITALHIMIITPGTITF